MTENTSTTKQVIVVRRDLKLKPGKLAAQVSHASIAFLTRKFDHAEISELGSYMYIRLSKAEENWLNSSFTKVCLGVDSEAELLEIHEQALVAELESHLITDAGYTVFQEPTNTCVGIGPDFNDKINAITSHLKLL